MNHLTRSTLLAASACLFIFSCETASAAITLTIDTTAKTFTWSGSATSSPIVVMAGDSAYLRLGHGTWNGGSISDTGGDSLVANMDFGSGWTVFFIESPSIGQIVVAEHADTIVTDLGFISNSFSESGNRTGTISVTGNGIPNSYSGYLGESIQFIEGLNGVELYFQNFQGGAGVTNIGPAAGQIVVIPEPSAAVIASFAALALLRRRRSSNKLAG